MAGQGSISGSNTPLSPGSPSSFFAMAALAYAIQSLHVHGELS